MVKPLILFGKTLSWVSKITNTGSGGTWPGEIALRVNPNILSYFFSNTKKGIIIVAGTNGKTTTSKIIYEFIEKQNPQDNIIHNDSGANLENGIVSACIQKAQTGSTPNIDWVVAEVDENTLPRVVKALEGNNKNKIKKIVVLTNLFRDQLDRYGEVDAVSEKWKQALKSEKTDLTIIANADDPRIAFIALESEKQKIFFGSSNTQKGEKQIEHATDSTLCPKCGKRLTYKKIFYSHIGEWQCESCKLTRPVPQQIEIGKTNLEGLYNTYNIQGALIVAGLLGIKKETREYVLKNFIPAFGRQEEFEERGRKIKIFLSKNPVGFNESIKTIVQKGGKNLMFVLNDRIPDGKDVSWIWDVDVKIIPTEAKITVSGDRALDMALRIKYEDRKYDLKEDLEDALYSAVENTKEKETLYILPTYSAMLEVRKIVSGKKIL